MTASRGRLCLSARFACIAIVAVGCAPVMAVVPRNGEAALATTQAEVHLAVFGSEWPGTPSDLPARVHAIYVDLRNASAQPLRISYQDFFLVDGLGFVARPLMPGTFSMNDVGLDRYDTLLASRGRRGFSASRSRTFGSRKRGISWSTRRFRIRYSTSFLRRGGRGFRASPTRDIGSLALREGTLEPGAHVAGYLYFAHAPGYTEGALDLAWDFVMLAPLQTLGRLQLPLESIRVR